MAGKLPQGGRTKIPGLDAAAALQNALWEAAKDLGDDSVLNHRPDGYFTAKEYSKLVGIASKTAWSKLQDGVDRGEYESVMARINSTGAPVKLYCMTKKTSEKESQRNTERGASKEHALATERGNKRK